MPRIDTVRSGYAATITMTNPPRHTMTASMVQELDDAVAALADDSNIRVVVLTGGGEGVFVAHYDVEELADASDRQQAGTSRTERDSSSPPRLHPYNRVMRRLEEMPKITVAALNGNAAGGGCELALACDFRLMSAGSYHLGLPETTVGIIPGAGGTQRLARLLGVGLALDLIVHGIRLSPSDALDLGLVHRVFPEDGFRDEVDAFVTDLCRRAPIALAAAKKAIRTGVEGTLEEGLLLEQALFAECMRTKDAAGAMRAALRGERYEFSGE